jgi:hypothetical protein
MALQIDIDNSSIIQLRAELKRLKNDIASATDPNQMLQLAEAAGQVQDKMMDVNEQVEIFAAGSPFERSSKQLGQVKNALLNLDFQKASDRAKALSNTIGGISFKDATAGLKNLGSTFVQLGKSLLTNPLFLLAAVIAAISFAIIKVLKDMGVFEKVLNSFKGVLEFVMFPLKLLIEGLESLAGWFGIAGDAANDFSKISIESIEKQEKEGQRRTNAIIDQLERQIRRRKLAGEETRDLERQIAEERKKLSESDKERLDDEIIRLEQRQRIGQKIDEELLSQLREKSREQNTILLGQIDDLEFFDLQTTDIKDKSSKRDEERDNQDRLRRENERKQERIAEEQKNKQRLSAIQRFSDEERDLRRKLQDIENELIKDELNRSLIISETRQKRAIEDLQRQNEIRIKALRDAGVSEEEIKGKQLELEEEFQTLKNAIQKQGESERENITKNHFEKLERQLLGYFQQVEEARKSDEVRAKETLDNALLDLETALENEIITKERYDELKLLAEEEYQKKLKEIREQEAIDLVAKNKKDYDDTIKLYKEKADAAEKYLNTAASFINTLFDIEENVGDESEEAQEARAKKRFEFNKAVNIGNALIQTSLAVATALANPPGPPFSIPQAVAAGIFGAAQVAAIASQPFKGSGGGSRGGTPSTPATPSTPNMQLFPSQPNIPQTQSEINTNINTGGSNEMTVKAYVVESEITKSQNTINKIQKLSEL